MNNREYNGWTNYETWVVNLWMDSEQGTYDYWREIAEDIYTNEAENPAVGSLGMNKMDDAVYLLADRLKDYHEEAKDNLLENANLISSIWADLLGSAMSEVNWREIAQHLLENVEVES